MSAWSWALRWLLGKDAEAREQQAQDKFTETMKGDSEPPISPDDLERRLDEIVSRVQDEAATLSSLHPEARKADDQEGDPTRGLKPGTLPKTVYIRRGRQSESGEEDPRGGERSSGTG